MDTVQGAVAVDSSSDEQNTRGKGLDSRAYQIEMFEQSMRENTIVAMETGSGKTQIAKLRIEAELERTPEKLIWFCAPSVVLAQQQHIFLSSQLPSTQVRLITGLDNVHFWSTQDVWDTVLDQIDLVVSTPQVLLDALSHGFVSLRRMSLLVFDEAHHCMAKSPMANIMQNFYHSANKRGDTISLPHILGLTASPITNKPSTLNQLEKNMAAVCKTPTLQVEDYKKYVHPPTLERIEFPSSGTEAHAIVQALGRTVLQLSINDDPTVAWLQGIENKSASVEPRLAKILTSGRTPVMKQMGSLLNHTTQICDDIGLWSADLYLRSCASRLHEAVLLNEVLVPQLADHEQKYIDLKLQPVVKSIPIVGNEVPEGRLVAPKAQALIDYLVREYQPGITVIIFVKRRSIAFALTRLFNFCPQMGKYEAFSFVGAASPANRTLVDLADMQVQHEAFADFQAGKRNVCIATQVMEEGVDVQATNLVIRFDEPENFRSFIQSRGRARRPGSKFVVMHQAEESDTIVKVRHWRELEQVMKEQYSDLTRHMLKREATELECENGDEVYHVESTGAVLTYDNAQQHLEHFCSTLPWESASEPARPTTLIFGPCDNFDDYKSAKIVLPASVPLPLQETNSLRTWRTERMAKKDAAFQTYKRLHSAKLVSDNLLPFPRARKATEKLEGRDSMYDVQTAMDPWRFLLNNFGESTSLQRHRIQVTGHNFALPSIVLLLPLHLDTELTFKLHDVAGGSSLVRITPENSTFRGSSDLARQVTHHLFLTILGRRLKKVNEGDRLPYLIVPDIIETELPTWFERVRSTIPLSDLSFNESLEQQSYLLKNGREEILYQWNPAFDPNGVKQYAPEASVMAERLSKQLSFLSNSQGDQYNEPAPKPDVRSLVVSDCQIQGLPASYGRFMLLMPSISHMLAVTLRGQLIVQDGPLRSIGFSNSELVRKALVSSSALSDHNYESLEFIGDSLLKYYASIQVFFSFPELTEGGLNKKYGAIASNARLQRASRELSLDEYITTENFSGTKWTLATTNNGASLRKMSSKTLADVVEALLGAAFLDPQNGPTKDEIPMSILRRILPNVKWKTPAAHIQDFHQQANLSKINIGRLEDVEGMLGYTFKFKSLLIEALTRTSLRVGSQSYQRLEFLGDGVLDRIVNIALFDSDFGLDPEHLKYRRDALVNRWILSYLAIAAQHTVTTNEATTSASGQTTFTQVSKAVRLIDHMRISHDRAEVRQRHKAEATFIQTRDEIATELNVGKTFPWVMLHSIDASKSYSDIIESILAAVYIDSKGSLSTCEQVLECLGLMKIVRRLTTEPDLEVRQPVVMLGLTYPAVVSEEKETGKLKDNNRKWTCTMRLDGVVVGSSESQVSQKHAEACAATMALDRLGGRKRSNSDMSRDE